MRSPPAPGTGFTPLITTVFSTGALANLAHNTFTEISFDTEFVDENNIWVVGTPSKFTIAATGKYLIRGRVYFQPDANPLATQSRRAIELQRNGAGIAQNEIDVCGGTGGLVGFACFEVVRFIALSAGDLIALRAFQNSGAAIPLQAGAVAYTSLEIVRLS